MSNVLIEKDKLDILATAISNKSGEPLKLTLDEMVSAVDGIETGGGGITPTGNIDITHAGQTDVTNYATATVPEYIDVDSGYGSNYYTSGSSRRWRVRYSHDGIGGWFEGGVVPMPYYDFGAVPTGITITPTESSQTIGGASRMMEGAVTVSAIPSNYVGSGITQRSSSDLTVSGATVTAPAGYYAESASKSVASGTAGTPTATKGTVSNHSVSVTPSVTNTTGYITGGTKTGTAVTVSASELTSGTKSITQNGTGIDVVGYAAVDVSVSGGGIDIPTFTVDSQYNVTCDKTFAECLALCDNDITAAVVTMGNDDYTAANNSIGSANSLTYTISTTKPDADIVYQSDGTITLVTPSSRVGQLTATANGTYTPTFPNTVFDSVTVNVSGGTVNNQNKTVTSSGTLQTVTYDSGYTGLGTVTINAAPSANVSSSFTGQFITENNIRKWRVTPSAYAESSGWVSEGSIPSATPTKYSAIASNTTIIPTESAQTVGGSNYMMEGAVTVGAIDSEYVGSLVPRVTATDITVSGPTVTMPSGFYSTELTKTVASGSATGPSSLSGTSATVSTGTNTLTLTKTNVTTTPTVSAGYVSSATASTASVSLTASVTVNPTPTVSGATVTIPAGYYSSQTTKSVSSGSASAPTSISGSTATVSTGTNTLTLTKTVSVTPVVSAGYVSSGTATNSSVSLTAAVTTKAATTYNTSTTDQTISSGTYLTGTQTIKAVTVSGLSADKILSGTTVMVGDSNDVDRIASVSGSVVIQKYYTGSSAPSSSLGSDGDIYLQE